MPPDETIADQLRSREIDVRIPRGEGLDRPGIVGGGGEEIDEIVDLPPTTRFRDKESLPKPDEFVAVEQEASWDPTELSRKIVYPEIARRSNVEGVVVLRVLVDRRGDVAEVLVDRSDNTLLEEAAIDAVRKTTFAPARQNRQPVATWIQVDVHFTIR